MFSERFQKHLEAQSKIFADKTTKWGPTKPWNSENRAFSKTSLAQMVAILPPAHPFYLHVWALHSRILPFGSVISPFQECQHSKFSPVQEKPERFWLLNRRKTSGFRSVSETQPSEKSTEKHHGSIISGIPEAFEHLPKPGDAWLLLKNGSKCCTNASHDVRVATRSWESAGHIWTIINAFFSVLIAQWVDLNVDHTRWGARMSLKETEKCSNG